MVREAEPGSGLLLGATFGDQRENLTLARRRIARRLIDTEAGRAHGMTSPYFSFVR
jgi:hypothetical protein